MGDKFEDMWLKLSNSLLPGTSVDNWTNNRGYLGDAMQIVEVTDKAIFVDSPNAKIIQRVPKTDFEKVWDVWEAYLVEKVQRQEIRDLTRFSKYIISIFHWLEKLEG